MHCCDLDFAGGCHGSLYCGRILRIVAACPHSDIAQFGGGEDCGSRQRTGIRGYATSYRGAHHFQ